MIPNNTKCTIISAPEFLSALVGQECIASTEQGARGTGTQAFKMDGGRMIYGNADSGFVVKPK